MNAIVRSTPAAMRYRIKGTEIYLEPLKPSIDGSYQTTGSGPRSRRLRAARFGPNAALDYTADGLRDQSRDLSRKNALAGSAIERLVSNVVGTGIRPQLSDPDTAALWLAWTDESDPGGALDFYGQQAQAFRGVVESGECFVRLRTRLPQDGLNVPLQLQIVESEYVPMDLNRVVEGGNFIRQGIEFDGIVRDRRVAYWMLKQHPNDLTPGTITNQPVRVPAEEVLHIYWPGRPGQIRGEPWLSRVLDRLYDVEAYDKAELVRKKVSALFVGFRRRNLPEGVSPEDLKEIWGDDAEMDGATAQVSLEPGTMQELEPGEEVEFSDPKDVGGQYEVFMRAQHRAIAAALGLLYEQLTGDYSQVNDRTWRAAVTEFRRRCEMWQHHLMVFQFCRPVLARWAYLAQLADKPIVAPLPAKWTPQAWPYINPVQDIQASRDAVRAGFTSRSAVVSERGEDAATIDAENKADNNRADEAGLSYESDGRKGAKAAKGPATPAGSKKTEEDDET